eukprot:gene12561-biopygen9498
MPSIPACPASRHAQHPGMPSIPACPASRHAQHPGMPSIPACPASRHAHTPTAVSANRTLRIALEGSRDSRWKAGSISGPIHTLRASGPRGGWGRTRGEARICAPGCAPENPEMPDPPARPPPTPPPPHPPLGWNPGLAGTGRPGFRPTEGGVRGGGVGVGRVRCGVGTVRQLLGRIQSSRRWSAPRHTSKLRAGQRRRAHGNAGDLNERRVPPPPPWPQSPCWPRWRALGRGPPPISPRRSRHPGRARTFTAPTARRCVDVGHSPPNSSSRFGGAPDCFFLQNVSLPVIWERCAEGAIMSSHGSRRACRNRGGPLENKTNPRHAGAAQAKSSLTRTRSHHTLTAYTARLVQFLSSPRSQQRATCPVFVNFLVLGNLFSRPCRDSTSRRPRKTGQVGRTRQGQGGTHLRNTGNPLSSFVEDATPRATLLGVAHSKTTVNDEEPFPPNSVLVDHHFLDAGIRGYLATPPCVPCKVRPSQQQQQARAPCSGAQTPAGTALSRCRRRADGLLHNFGAPSEGNGTPRVRPASVSLDSIVRPASGPRPLSCFLGVCLPFCPGERPK